MGRVVYVLRAFPEPSETFIRNEIRALRRIGVPVAILAGARSSPPAADWTPEDESDVPVTVPRASALAAVRGAASSTRLGPRQAVRAGRLIALAESAAPLLPDDTAVLHAHFANDAAVLARQISAISGIPYRVTAHAYDIYQDPLELEANLRGAARVLTISEANAAYIREQVPGLRALEVIRCGIDLDRFAYRDPLPISSPARLSCAARLVPKKGHESLFESVAALRANGMDVTLACAGDGPLDAVLRARAGRPDLVGAVSFLGTVGNDAVRAEMLRSDAVVLAARVAEDGDRDGIPVALIEAMALGVPVVSTSVSGIPELVTPGTGRLVPDDDPKALTGAIRETHAAPHEARVAQTRAARARVEAEFDIAKIVAALQ